MIIIKSFSLSLSLSSLLFFIGHAGDDEKKK